VHARFLADVQPGHFVFGEACKARDLAIDYRNEQRRIEQPLRLAGFFQRQESVGQAAGFQFKFAGRIVHGADALPV
jgi:hypothetical protein